jgi:hypothetical protein
LREHSREEAACRRGGVVRTGKVRLAIPKTDEKIVVAVPEGAVPGTIISFPLSKARHSSYHPLNVPLVA